MKRVRQPADISGYKFGHLTVLKYSHHTLNPCGKKEHRWLCRCSCGNEKAIGASNLRSGSTISCGCHRRSRLRKHGLSSHPLYHIWGGMIRRCHKPDSPTYSYYGGRGISVCKRWRNSFEAFVDDMGPRPSPEHSIDRIDNNGNYEPNNCRWATRSIQGGNTRDIIRVKWKGDYVDLTTLSRVTGIPKTRIYSRLKAGASVEDAVATGNARDRRLDGKPKRRSPYTKINKRTAKRIRAMYKKGGWTHRSLADHFGVSSSNIGAVLNNTIWKD